MPTVAQYLATQLAALGKTPADVNVVLRFVPAVGMWLDCGKQEFIAAAQQVEHPISNGGDWYMLRALDEDRVMLYNGSTATVYDPTVVFPITEDQLAGTAAFPGD